MKPVDPSCLTLFPPGRWSGGTPVVDVGEWQPRGTRCRLEDEDCDRIERDLRGILARRLQCPVVVAFKC